MNLYRIWNRLVLADNEMQAVERAELPPAYISAAIATVALASGPLFKKGLYVGCTLHRHREIGVHAGINARGGEAWRNWYESPRIDQRNSRQRLAELRVPGYRLVRIGRDSFGSARTSRAIKGGRSI